MSQERYWGEANFSRLSWFSCDRVAQVKVMVVGAGALGNEVLKGLVLFGVQSIVIVDYDHVEQSNLCRSILFRESDAQQGRPKVEVAAQRLREINPRVRVSTICGDVSYDVGLGLMRSMDVVISCVDSRYARYSLCRLAFRAGVDWVDGGIDGLEGTARVFRLGENCYACNLGERGLREMSRRMSCAQVVRENDRRGRVATTPIVSSIIGAVQVQEAMKLLHREQLESGKMTSLCGKMFYWEGEHLSSKVVEFREYHDDCPLHDRWDGVEPIQMSCRATVEEFLERVESEFGAKDARIVLRDRSFVESVCYREGSQEPIEVMRPDFRTADYLTQKIGMERVEMSQLYAKEHREIGREEIFRGLTLSQLGIPNWDVVQVATSEGRRYLELVGDAYKI